jgi:ABC-2 type transport system ATP-binding protein
VDDLVIETRGLRKEYRGARGRRIPVVRDLDLRVPAGGVHGLLGPNGSGKTTTIRMLLGLARPSAGDVWLFGEPVPRRLPHVAGRVGAVVGHPRFVPGFSARHNLTLLADSAGIDRRQVDSVLERVGIHHDREAYRSLPLGGKQRLAIAAALLKKPDLLVLDEPTNGLDPAGIRDLRRLVRDLGRSGATVLLSSHLLAEVQQVCDSVSIIGEGTLLSSGSVEELVGRERPGGVRVGLPDLEAALPVLRDAGLEVVRDGQHLYVAQVADPTEITRLLASHDIWVRELIPDSDLEQLLLELTERRSAGPSTEGGR